MIHFQIPLKRVIDDSYDIEIGENLFDSLKVDINQGLLGTPSKIALITDSNVKKLYLSQILEALEHVDARIEVFSFTAGEQSKTRETKARIEDQMLDAGFGRDSAVIAFGGGVVSDLAGFLAGTFGRGIPFAVYSTTVLSAADASVGGKTAVDTPHATNLIGLFNQPKKVYIDTATWRTLPPREVRCGLAETVKHAILADASFFHWLEEKATGIVSADDCELNKALCDHIAVENCRIKHEVVARDERESNLRQILNLGHTGGRALETLMEFEYLHGEAVSVGLVIASAIAMDLGFMEEDECHRVINLLARLGLPVEIPESISSRQLVQKMYTDKKVRSGKIRFVLPQGIGAMKQFDQGNYSIQLEEDYLVRVIEDFRS